mgnify:FL=1
MKKKLVSIMLVAAMALSVAACGSSKETLQRRTEPKQWLPV